MISTKKLRSYFWSVIKKNHQNIRAFAIILAIVLVGNFIYVSGIRDSNPTLQLSGLAVEASTRVIEGVDTIDPNNGFTTQTLGNLSAHKLLSGDLPLWNHYEGVGSPLAGEMQSAALSPFVLLLAYSGGVLLLHMLLEIIAGFFTYLFLKRLKIGWSAAVIGGVIFALNGTFAWLTNAVFNPIALLPMLMYGTEIALSSAQNKKNRGWALVAIALALSLYAGFPETAFINSLLVGAWVLIRMMTIAKPVRLAYIKKIVLGALIGLLLAAPILVAFLGYLPDANIGGHSDAFSHASLGKISAPAQLFPYVYGPLSAYSGYDKTNVLSAHWGSIGGYFAVSVFMFAVLGLFSKLDRKLKFVLSGWIVLCLLKMFGFDLAEFFWNIVPTIKNAAFFRYATPSMSFALTVLAAFGIQGFTQRTFNKRQLLISTGIITGTLLILAYIARTEMWRISSAPHHKAFAVASVLWGLTILLSLVFTYVFVKQKYQAAFTYTLICLDVVIMFIVPQLSTPSVKIDTLPVEYLQQNIGLNRYYTLGPIAPNYGSYYRIASINQNDLPVPKRWSDYLNKNLDTNTDPILFIGYYRRDPNGATAFSEFVRNQNNFRYVGVKYLVTTHMQLSVADIKEANLTQVLSSKGVDIYSVADPENYFSLPSHCSIMGKESRDQLVVKCSAPAKLIRKELWIRGWTAKVNGITKPIAIENNLFQKVELKQGISKIKFNYAPPFMLFGWLAFVCGLIAILWPTFTRLVAKLKRCIVKFTHG